MPYASYTPSKYTYFSWSCGLELQNTQTVSQQKGKITLPHECSQYDSKQSDGALGNVEYPFIAIVPRSAPAQSGST